MPAKAKGLRLVVPPRRVREPRWETEILIAHEDIQIAVLRHGASEEVALSTVQAVYARLERTDPEPGRLPDPTLEVPDRDPEAIKDDVVAHAYRSLFWDLGIDPTKTRPAGEALARGLARGDELPRIHPLVDAVNIASAVTLIPLHILDADRITTPLEIAKAPEGATFDPIGGSTMTLTGRHPIIQDEDNILALLAHRDGEHAKITSDSTDALVIACGPPASGPRLLPDAFRHVERYATLAGWSFIREPETVQDRPGVPR